MSVFNAVGRSQEDFRSYFASHARAKWIALFSLTLVMLMVVLPLSRLLPIVRENPFIPLHYNIYLGIDGFGPWYRIFILPVLGLVMLVLNLSLASRFSEIERRTPLLPLGFHQGEPMLAQLVLWLTPILEVVLFAGVVFTLLLNL
ncbi:TPA: hypothetical protein DDZ10_04445 [Candidatus Uhrbacteria bacterium]|uniref:DUF1648 domain-containing protein n=1 Tax=Candidatus Uhrbacteria bacterium GW2011_GWC2_53_7 TaxID=1618986 RepID=A0A0G2AVL0_9BACT|nr:MAG: hypothetical protein UY79_C0005G0047 [Parcubacteria group bacterium GW2011_GWA2_53_21]KKW36939.1 MAG: hypothetical protein UY82_C0007G0007 [Candidatus Uhrbacteria bacterium GW2011_GWC2_53_7]OGL72002.1 MAG: hypothetical protein A3D69_00650 [Candidatus Uhrbacteria bacterium RIFCSPHIGHO2_02_FULL_54_11]HBL39884.1 hypothetical protein [Candidatus Uhrbacteria bacterium]